MTGTDRQFNIIGSKAYIVGKSGWLDRESDHGFIELYTVKVLNLETGWWLWEDVLTEEGVRKYLAQKQEEQDLEDIKENVQGRVQLFVGPEVEQ